MKQLLQLAVILFICLYIYFLIKVDEVRLLRKFMYICLIWFDNNVLLPRNWVLKMEGIMALKPTKNMYR